MHPTMNIVCQAVRQAGRLLLRQIDVLNDTNLIESKRDRIVIGAYASVLEELKQAMQEPFPDHVILAAGDEMPSRANDLWVIHAIDPISHYERALPHYAVSMTWYNKGKVKGAVVYNPILDECFCAVLNQGAQLNQHRIRIAKRGRKFSSATIANRFPNNPDLISEHVTAYAGMADQLGCSEQSACASLAIAYVACGRYDGYWHIADENIIPSAALLIAKEAGAMVTNWRGQDTLEAGERLMIATPSCYPDLQKYLLKSIAK